MNRRTILGAAVLVAVTAAMTAAVMKQDRPGDAEAEQMMQRWMEKMTPGEPHQRLEALVGTWEQKVEWWMTPGTEPTVSRGTVTYETIMGGRFLQGQYQGTVMDQPFEGLDLLGYDNFRKEYVSVWLDNMSTAIMISRGQYKSDQKVIEMTGTVDDVMTGERDKPIRSLTHLGEPDTVVYEMYTHGPDGREFLSLRVTSTRK